MGNTIWVGANRGRVLGSTGRGEHWPAFETPVDALFYDTAFSGPLHGIARYTFSDGQRETKTMLITTDGRRNLAPVYPRYAVYDMSSLPGVPGAYLCSTYTLCLERLGKDKGFGFSLEVLNARGRRLAKHQARNDDFILPLAFYTTGLYYLRIEQHGAVYSGKFIK